MQVPIPTENRFYVYEHVRADNGAVFYVGKGTGPRAFVGSKHHRNIFWQRIVSKAGGFSVRMIAENITEELAFFIEVEQIDKLKMIGIRLCNLTSGGEGTSGWIKTKEWKEKVGHAHRGKTLSTDTRSKISESLKMCGYKPSEEARAKMSKAHIGKKRALGYKHTEEWKKNKSITAKGNKSRSGQKRSEEERAKVSLAMKGRPQAEIICPKCGKSGGNAMRRWHFENCKLMGGAK